MESQASPKSQLYGEGASLPQARKEEGRTCMAGMLFLAGSTFGAVPPASGPTCSAEAEGRLLSQPEDAPTSTTRRAAKRTTGNAFMAAA